MNNYKYEVGQRYLNQNNFFMHITHVRTRRDKIIVVNFEYGMIGSGEFNFGQETEDRLNTIIKSYKLILRQSGITAIKEFSFRPSRLLEICNE